MKITKIEINDNLEECAGINLILGSNNTGKSTFIKELEQAATNAEINKNNKWIKSISLEMSGAKTKFDSLFPSISTYTTFEGTHEEMNREGKSNIFGSIEWNGEVFEAIKSKADDVNSHTIGVGQPRNRDWHYFKFFSKMAVSIESCEQRLSGPFSTQITRIDESYRDVVHFLYSQRDVFEKIANHIQEVFGIKIEFDNLQQGQRDIRLAPNVARPESFANTREEARFWNENSPTLASQGDGLKAYLKILYALFNPAKDIVIIDEPEAFLHSPQRRSLGKFIAENATSGKQIFISTHDSEFLRGVLTNTTQDTQIIHLKNNAGVRSYKINKIPTSTRSQNNNELVLNSYFNKLTVLCEAEDDRMIYQYASQVFFPTESVDTYFLGQNAKSGVFAVFKELKSLEIRVEVITDIDVLYSGECISYATEQSERNLLDDVKKSLNTLSDSDRKNFKEKGFAALSDPILMGKVQQALAICKKYNINVVPVGELESWVDSTPIPKRIVQSIRNEIDTTPSTTKKIALKDFIHKVISC
jgi:predicted ATPase